MKIEKTSCPYCGASLKLAPGQKTAECEYCGNSVLITNAESAPYEADSAFKNRHFSEIPENRNKAIPKTKSSMLRKHTLFPPPGFRTLNIVHMIT